MAYREGVSDFVRVQGQGADPNVVYATGIGGKPMSSEAELAQYSGGAITSGGKVRTITPEEAKSLGIIDFAKAPTNQIDNTGAVLTQNNTQQQIDTLSKQIAEYQATQKSQAEAATKASTGLLDKVTGLITQRQEVPTIDPQAAYEQALGKYGFTPEMFTQMNQAATNLQTINSKIADLDTQEQNALMANDQRQTSMSFIEGEGAKISRAYAIKKSGLSAQAYAISTGLEAARGNLNQANQLASQAVQNLVYARQQKVDDLNWAINTYSDLYSNMSAKEQNAWNNVYNMATKDLETKKADYTAIMNLVVENPTASWPVDVSTLTLSDAVKIAQEWKAKLSQYDIQKAQLQNQMLAEQIRTEKAQQAKLYADAQAVAVDETGLTAKEKKDINASIKGQLAAYKLAPDGFREKLAESMVSQYGESARDFISKGIYAQLPDNITGGGQADKQTQSYVNLGMDNLNKAKNALGINNEWNGGDELKLLAITMPRTPGVGNAYSNIKEAILNLAYASSGKQMSWQEAEQRYGNYIPKIDDSTQTKITRLKNLFDQLQLLQSGKASPISSSGNWSGQTASGLGFTVINTQ